MGKTDTKTDPWDVDEGFGAPYTGTVLESQFVTDPQYMDGEVLMLEMTVRIDEHEDPEQKGEERHERYPVGKGWETNDRGKTAEHPRGKERFHAQSAYGRIVAGAIGKNAGYDCEFDGLADVLRKRGVPTEAKIWEGLTFRFETVEFDYGGDIGKKSRMMPVEFLGADGAKGKVKKSKKEDSGDDGPSEKDVRKALVKIAADADSFDEFVERALAETEVEDFDKLLAEVNDEDEFWAEHGS